MINFGFHLIPTSLIFELLYQAKMIRRSNQHWFQSITLWKSFQMTWLRIFLIFGILLSKRDTFQETIQTVKLSIENFSDVFIEHNKLIRSELVAILRFVLHSNMEYQRLDVAFFYVVALFYVSFSFLSRQDPASGRFFVLSDSFKWYLSKIVLQLVFRSYKMNHISFSRKKHRISFIQSMMET